MQFIRSKLSIEIDRVRFKGHCQRLSLMNLIERIDLFNRNTLILFFRSSRSSIFILRVNICAEESG